MRRILPVILLAACGPGEYEVEPLTTDYDCPTFDHCAVMAGGELFARPILYTDVGEWLSVKSVAVEPADVAEVTVEGDYIAIRPAPLSPGTEPSPISGNYATLRVTLHDDYEFYRTFTIAPRATTSITPDRDRVPLDAFAERKLPGERLAIFTGDSLLLIAEHRAADGSRLLGHTSDTWTGEGVQLAELPDNNYSSYDRELMRAARAGALGPAAVNFGTSTLALDVVSSGSTARLEVINHSNVLLGDARPLNVSAGSAVQVQLLAYAPDGRYIYGGPPYFPVTVTTSDPSIADLEGRTIYADRNVWLKGYRSGTATLTFHFDGLTIDVPVSVE